MNKGFTLIELLAVIVILAIVMIITIPRVLIAIKESKVKALESDVVGIYKSIERHINKSQLDLSGEIDESPNYEYNCPSKYWSEDKSVCLYKYDSSLGMKSLKVKIEWDLDEEYSYIIYDGLNYEYIDGAPIVYGVRFANSSTGTRTDSAIGMTYSNPSESNVITSDFDGAEIYREMVEVTDEYDNVFIKIPKFYIKKTTSTGNIWTYQISKKKVDDYYYLPACFVDEQTNTELPYILVGKYLATINGTLLESKPGTTPTTSKGLHNYRPAARNNGAGYQLLDVHIWDVIQVLFYIEFATLDAQSIMKGYTATTNTINLINGTTDTILGKTGSTTDNTSGLYAMKYRGIENVWGNIFQFLDGIVIKNYRSYVSKDATTYVSISTLDPITNLPSSYLQISYTNSTSSYYARDLGYDSNNPYINIPIYITSTYGSSIYKDYYWRSSTTTYNYAIMVGGNRSCGDRAGLNYWKYTTIIDSPGDCGSRLVKTPS